MYNQYGCSINGKTCCSGYMWDPFKGQCISEYNVSLQYGNVHFSKYACKNATVLLNLKLLKNHI